MYNPHRDPMSSDLVGIARSCGFHGDTRAHFFTSEALLILAVNLLFALNLYTTRALPACLYTSFSSLCVRCFDAVSNLL